MSRGEPRMCACGCEKPAKKIFADGKHKSWRAYAAGCAPNERLVIKTVTDPVKLSYAAGIIDGEGCIYAAIRTYNGYPSTFLQLGVVMCSEIVIQWLHETFGGSVYVSQPPSANHQVRFSWQVRGRNAPKVLKSLLPYLLEKRKRAVLAIELGGMIGRSKPGRSRALSEGELECRASLALRIKGYNRDPRGEDLAEAHLQ